MSRKQKFQPYDRVRDANPQARQAGAALMAEGANEPQRKTCIYVNNRLEGNALETIHAMMEIMGIN